MLWLAGWLASRLIAREKRALLGHKSSSTRFVRGRSWPHRFGVRARARAYHTLNLIQSRALLEREINQRAQPTRELRYVHAHELDLIDQTNLRPAMNKRARVREN